MLSEQKEIFIIHSKSHLFENELYLFLFDKLQKLDIKCWEYEDWEWDPMQEDKAHSRITLSGRPEHYFGQTKDGVHLFKTPRKANIVDETTLAEMIHSSLLVLIIESKDQVSEGKVIEHKLIPTLAKGPLYIRIKFSDCENSIGEKIDLAASYCINTENAREEDFPAVYHLTLLVYLLGFLMRSFRKYSDVLWQLTKENGLIRDILSHHRDEYLLEQHGLPDDKGKESGKADLSEIKKMFSRMDKLTIGRDWEKIKNLRSLIDFTSHKNEFLESLSLLFSRLEEKANTN